MIKPTKLSITLKDRFPLPKAFVNWHEYFALQIGQRRLGEILRSLKIPLRSENQILEKNLALLLLSIQQPKRNDLQEGLDQRERFPFLDQNRETIKTVEDLSSQQFALFYEHLANPLDQKIELEIQKDEIEDRILNSLYFLYASFRYDPFWYLKERCRLKEEDHKLPLPFYYEKLAGFYATCEDLEVGSYIPAPSEDIKLYYRVAAKLFTGSGQISWVLLPATKDTPLDPIRMTRGSPGHPAGYDFASHIVTDFEKEIGKMGYESGLKYEPFLQDLFQVPHIEVGYSIGGSIAQYRTASDPSKIKSLWTFRSPGVPRRIWKEFQEKQAISKRPLDIHIYRSKRDIVDQGGEVHLGLKALDSVNVSLVMMNIPRILPHRYSVIDPKIIKLEKVELKEMYLDNGVRGKLEHTRQVWGPKLLSSTIRFCRDIYRKAPFHRIHTLRGLWIEEPKEGCWQTRHIP